MHTLERDMAGDYEGMTAEEIRREHDRALRLQKQDVEAGNMELAREIAGKRQEMWDVLRGRGREGELLGGPIEDAGRDMRGEAGTIGMDQLEADESDWASMDLPTLAGLRDMYGRNWESENRVARARGGVGHDTPSDEQARAYSRKHMAAEGEILDRLEDVHNSRSVRAQEQDERLRARKTTDPITWVQDPAHWDYPGLDTPR